MTKYTAVCRENAADTITAEQHAPHGVVLYAFHGDDFELSVHLRASDARTFARGILALADEVDGGEPETGAGKSADDRAQRTSVVAGDKLRVTRTDLNLADVHAGDVVTVEHVDDDGGFTTVGRGWRFEAYHVGNGLELLPADEPLKVGDFVAVTKTSEHWSEYRGRVGRLTQIDAVGIPYRVDFSDADYAWAVEVARTEAPVPSPAPSFADPARVALLKEAREIADHGFVTADTVAVARFLAGE